MSKSTAITLTVAAALAVGSAAQAATLAVSSETMRWSGFISAAATQLYAKDGDEGEPSYLERIGSDMEFSDSRMGLNVSADLSAELSVAGQLLMAGREDDYNAHADWVFVTYRPATLSNTLAMIGRIKYPNLLFSEVGDVGYAYPWMRAPEEIYDISALGGQYNYEVISGGSLLYAGYSGDFEYAVQPFGGEADSAIGRIDNLTGVALSVNHDFGVLKLGYHQGTLAGDGGHGHGGDPSGGADPLSDVMREELAGADKSVVNLGLNLDISNFLLWAEMASTEWDGDEHVKAFDTDSWYISLGYRFNKVIPLITIAEMDQESGLNQKSITFGMRYELSRSAAMKLEWKNIDISGRDAALHYDVEHFEADPITNIVELHVEEEHIHQAGFAMGTEEESIDLINFSIDVVF